MIREAVRIAAWLWIASFASLICATVTTNYTKMEIAPAWFGFLCAGTFLGAVIITAVAIGAHLENASNKDAGRKP
jgi:hypothetical protein